MIAWLVRGWASRAAPYLAGAAVLGALVLWGTIERQRGATARTEAASATLQARTDAKRADQLAAYIRRAAAAEAIRARTLAELRSRHERDAAALARIPADACLDLSLPAAVRLLLDADSAADARQPAAAPGR